MINCDIFWYTIECWFAFATPVELATASLLAISAAAVYRLLVAPSVTVTR